MFTANFHISLGDQLEYV